PVRARRNRRAACRQIAARADAGAGHSRLAALHARVPIPSRERAARSRPSCARRSDRPHARASSWPVRDRKRIPCHGNSRLHRRRPRDGPRRRRLLEANMLTRRVHVGLTICCLLAAGTARAQSPEQLKVLSEIKAADKDLLAVSEEDGHLLRVMVASSGAKRALEVGGAFGYSAIWIGLGLRQ